MRTLNEGDPVRFWDSHEVEYVGLCTRVHGTFSEGGYIPCINVIVVSKDASKTDPYGVQMERHTSVGHISYRAGDPSGKLVRGMTWDWIE